MKTITTFLLATAFVFSASAASIEWSITGSTSYVMKDYLGEVYSTMPVYLIAASDVSSITDPDNLTKQQFTEALEALTIATATSAADGTKPSVTGLEVTSPLMEAGTKMKFGLLIVSEDQDYVYYKLLTGEQTPYATGASADAHTRIQTAWNTVGGKTWTKAAAVPEPSTAALALAGLALLLKRRKA